MKAFSRTFVALVVATSATLALGAALKSGLQPGKAINPFDVVKCSEGVDDGVECGDQLCYRCKYGSKPMVMVFARTSDEKLCELVKKLDAAVAEHADDQLKSFVNLLGESRDSLEESAKKLGEDAEVKNVPIVVPVEFENGPEDYGINPEADVTIIMAVGGKVKVSHAVEAGKLDDETVGKILADVPSLLK